MPQRDEYTSALPDQRFGRLVVISANGKSRLCRCDCGKQITVDRTSTLTSGNTQSCGCLRKEVAKAAFLQHGATVGRGSTAAYRSWQGMLQRCLNPNNKKYLRYGGRGIAVCARWLESFQNFHADMGDPPPGLTIGRRDNDGPYTPENCRWETDTEQARNKSTSHTLTYNGRSQTIAAWAEELKISRHTIDTRLRLGWSIGRVLSGGHRVR